MVLDAAWISKIWYHPPPGHYTTGWTPGHIPGMSLLHSATSLHQSLTNVSHQFIPQIRYKALLVHRINGYIIILLLLLANIGALMIARHSFGGEFETQVLVGLLAIITTFGAFMAYYNIKRLQIDQHRAWMLRTWFYAGSIVTLRIIMILSALIVSKNGGYYRAMPCDEVKFLQDSQDSLAASYPQCLAVNGTVDGYVAVPANFGSKAHVASALNITFGTAGWLALTLHAVGVEVYLALTPRESERLRGVSYQRQLEAGFSHPGSAGITVDRWGDAEEWKPPEPEEAKPEE